MQQHDRASLLVLTRNFGQQNALCAGLDHCQADVVAIIDADMQDPPEVILKMLEKWREGFEVIYAQRVRRDEPWFKNLCYWSFYRLLSLLANVRVPLDAGDFSLLDRKVIEALKNLPEVLRFPRGLRAWVGYRQVGISYQRPRRHLGSTKYSWRKLYHLATDGIASLSLRPLRVTQLFSIGMALISFLMALFTIYRIMITESDTEPWFLAGYLLNFSTSTIICFGIYIMSAYLGRTYIEVKHRPTYLIRETLHSKNQL